MTARKEALEILASMRNCIIGEAYEHGRTPSLMKRIERWRQMMHQAHTSLQWCEDFILYG